MTPPNKPEWIKLTDADSAPRVKKSNRALPALVLAAALSIVGVGALVAQTGSEVPVTTSEQGVNPAATSSATQTSAASPMASNDSTSMPNPNAISQPGAPKRPGIASMPTGGGDDDDEDDDEDEDEDEDDEDDEDEDDEDDEDD
jgi:hypothetical protein